MHARAEPDHGMDAASVRLCHYYFEQDSMSIKLSLAVALAIYAAHWTQAPGWPGTAWLLAVFCFQGLRLWYLQFMRTKLADPAGLQAWFPSLYLSVLLAALLWSSMLFAFPHRQFDFGYMFKIIALAAINSVTILSHGLIFRLYALFSSVLTLVVLIQLHGFDQVMATSDRHAFSGIALLYLSFLLITAWKYAERNRAFFTQQQTMNTLVSSLKRMHDEEVELRSSLELKTAGLEEARNALLVLATTDSLTRTLNRRAILEQLQQQVDKVSHAEGSFCVLAFDVDNFKKINDVFGHNVGDVVLQVLAEEVKASLRPEDGFGRIGGEEFLVILPGLNLPEAVACGERLRLQLQHSTRMQQEAGIAITLSLGCCLAFPGESAVDILGKADTLMYQAKREGKNRLCY
ncbi:GGDEF domain-containing protein [Aquitalea pelogenes]|uniref:GGDEF domain-containing protein n=1 Tax=Aquitalea pelogenes TaxID=1293573 RepID=UPI0035B4AE3C